ncbi:MAG: hypothetical protein JXR52_04570 [Bacteroidales bacterium]|nr:hypothetical protein [Bacteroidales bacterium]
MSILSRILFSQFLVLLACSSVSGQTIRAASGGDFDEIARFVKEKQESNNLLLNGIYFDNPYYNTSGHPFLGEDRFLEGSVVYWNRRFDNLLLKYDLFAQQLLLHHEQQNPLVIVLPNDFITEFRMNGMTFRKVAVGEEGPCFCQVVAEEAHAGCYYYRYKVRHKSNYSQNLMAYIFSDERQNRYIRIEDSSRRYRNNRTFVKAFPESMRGELRNYLRSEKTRVKEADDGAMAGMIKFCNEILEQKIN